MMHNRGFEKLPGIAKVLFDIGNDRIDPFKSLIKDSDKALLLI
ncbi:hypothetical protein HALO32_02423 [Halomonas lysinitropha]|uniref:Uncharacterized protein n=1 Tax=Halomonas lysinitropha TaxID=2607506 RepID=A0A5K1I812_9GAMM|nr:hypothetical protein HALO32_02423 [Halomonas lysinitropha]